MSDRDSHDVDCNHGEVEDVGRNTDPEDIHLDGSAAGTASGSDRCEGRRLGAVFQVRTRRSQVELDVLAREASRVI